MDKDLRAYLSLVRRWWWLLIVGTIIPAVISYALASRQPDLYQARATVVVGTSVFQDPDPNPQQLSLSNTLAGAYAELLRQGPVAEAVINRLGLQVTPEQLVDQISTRVHSGAQLLVVEVTDTNPEAAALIANALADELIRRSPTSGAIDPVQQEFIQEQLEELQVKITNVGQRINDLTVSLDDLTSAAEIQDAQDRIAELEEVKSTYQATYASLLEVYQAESPNVLSLFEPATVPQWPMPSKTKLIVAVAGAAGFGLALGAVLLMEYLDTSLRWEGDGPRSIMEVPVLGAIPRTARRNGRVHGDPSGPVAEGARAVYARIHLVCPEQRYQVLHLTSPSVVEDKSLVLANLAILLASSGKRVIVVDADLRKPSQHELFDQPNVVGLTDGLDAEVAPLSSFLQETGFENLYLLSAGRHPMDPIALLTSRRFPALLESLKDMGDVILIDSPPVMGPPDAMVLATMVEGTILVVSAGVTSREAIRKARDRLRAQKGVNLLGLVVNRARLDSRYGADERGGKSEPGSEDDDKAWLTPDEAATRLGIGKHQAHRWCKDGRLPATRKWLRWRVNAEKLEAMLEDTWVVDMKSQGWSNGGNEH